MSPLDLSRRKFLLAAVPAAVPCILPDLAQAQAYKHPWNEKIDPEAEGLTGYFNHGNLFVRYDNQPVLTYRLHDNLKYPYFAPLMGPASGLSLVTESALPYPHHRGLWLGCEPLMGGDYWGHGPLSEGQIRSTGFSLDAEGRDGEVRFSQTCEWVREGAESPLQDERHFKITAPSAELRMVDCQLRITARTDVQIDKAKHSFFAVRAAPDISPTYGGTLVNAAGQEGAAGTYGNPSPWCSYFGPRKQRPDVVEGITIMNHPENFGGDCPWFTRDYGHLSPQPFVFRKEPLQLPRGDTLNLRYRVVLHRGNPFVAGMDALFESWLQSA
jgi:hypothetical protein